MNQNKPSGRVRFLPPIKRYVNAIEWHLHLPFKQKQRVMADLFTSIEARHEAGESYEQIMQELGSPRQVAAGFNAEMGAGAGPRGWYRFFVVLAAACGAWTLVCLATMLWQGRQSVDLGIIGGADGPTAIFVTSTMALPPLAARVWYAAPVLLGAASWAMLCKWRHAGRGHYWAAAAVAAAGLAVYALGFSSMLAGRLGGFTDMLGGFYPWLRIAGQAALLLLWPGFWLPLSAFVTAVRRAVRAGRAEL